ncbi:flagellar protein FlgN [Campylobacter insulaenigrae]|uniref:Flagellar biosynthesis protein FlgN n=2 Tax=Campylobacter insulaenigrae TaxID=260714 RepID=A0A0A8H3A7_9BACT|nr:flagellar protein FlgN [Campylobacter insulaenigrae]AJC87379.1 flagellar biosynthesis protein FlgN [Campylobacter insulaenigrae NCTC 12927]MCR6570490.1 flagellar protein FlgN [Campylobacter insulaenigrae]MCR6572092.1 flagellar protein FlgN [Campylobacter insulaenigrae]MCR6573801.1 flagellar protein FlgN [Campylobacter insulaenigrae]MCR6575563.1 flagellar protein FlgN [Campylobacter insulaenigrae]
MVKRYLDETNLILEKLINLTIEDITHIQAANHEHVNESVENKTKLIGDFQTAKKNLDQALIDLSNSGNNKGLDELLDDEDKEKLALLKENLNTLHQKNKEYAKLVLVIKDFYDNLLNTMFEQNGTNNAYGDSKTIPDSLFKINV